MVQASATKPADTGDLCPVTFEVLLPAEAVLEVNGEPTRATGPMRRFQSPPLAEGEAWPCTLRAVWRGKSVTRRLSLRAGSPATRGPAMLRLG